MALMAPTHLSLRKSSGWRSRVKTFSRWIGPWVHSMISAVLLYLRMREMSGSLERPSHLVMQDVAGAAQVFRRLAQGAARQQRLGAEGRAGIDQHDVDAVGEIEILHAVVEQERVRVELVRRRNGRL